jgi:hypothetical protein
MKGMVGICVVGLTLFSGGCAVARGPLVLREAVGPQSPDTGAPLVQGNLVVYSAHRVTTYAQSEYPVHTDYTIYNLGGKVIERVANTAGSFNQDPATVRLPPGEYRVKALLERGGQVIVPVIVERGRTTIVDLDGTAFPQDANAQGRWVRLPDGHVVGWQSDCVRPGCG